LGPSLPVREALHRTREKREVQNGTAGTRRTGTCKRTCGPHPGRTPAPSPSADVPSEDNGRVSAPLVQPPHMTVCL